MIRKKKEYVPMTGCLDPDIHYQLCLLLNGHLMTMFILPIKLNNNHYIPREPVITNVIHSIWQVDQFTSFTSEYIIPKGIVEIIFNFSDGPPIVAQLATTPYQLPNCFINGFNTAPIQLQLPKQQVFYGVVFQPFAIRKIFGIPASCFTDSTVDVTLFHTAFQSLWHQLAEQDNFNSRVSLFLNWIKSCLIEWQPQEHLLNQFLYAFHQHPSSVKELANSLCYSPRHLSRKLLEATRMNTEEILLYKKYLHAVHLIHHTNLPLTTIAYDSRFADQSHFIKTFKAFTNMTPGEYRRDKGDIKGHLYKDVR